MRPRTAQPASTGHLDIVTPITKLAQRWQNLYAKREEENRIKFGLTQATSAEEARLFVARAIYIDNTRKEEAAKQVPMFEGGRLPKARRR